MLKITSIKKMSKKLGSGEFMFCSPCDIENAASEIWKAESFVSGDGLWNRRIGFIAIE